MPVPALRFFPKFPGMIAWENGDPENLKQVFFNMHAASVCGNGDVKARFFNQVFKRC